MREVVDVSLTKDWAVTALFLPCRAFSRVMANTCKWPHVMHCPDDGFATREDLADATKREHALIDPMQVDDVCLLKGFVAGDVRTSGGSVHFE